MTYNMFFHRRKVRVDPLTNEPVYDADFGEEDLDFPLDPPNTEAYTEELNNHMKEIFNEDDDY